MNRPPSPLIILLSRHTSRREVIAGLGASVACPLPGVAQQPKVPTVGFLVAGSPSSHGAFVQRLSELGWIEGRTILIEYRWAEGSRERASEIAAEFARLQVDLIVTSGVPSARAAKQATSSIPIVFAVVSDPVGAGLIASLARPEREYHRAVATIHGPCRQAT